MTPIFDTGHGGMINGIYQTPGKRSPNWSQGILYEGMFNRWVVNRLIEKLDRNAKPYYHISPEIVDTSLTTRIKRANDIYKSNKNVYVLSIHANAGGGRGIEGFTSTGNTKSDEICESFLKRLEADMTPTTLMRVDLSDGDMDKERNDLAILKQTNSPAILLEMGFMDNKIDYNLLWSKDYMIDIVDSIFCTIMELYDK